MFGDSERIVRVRFAHVMWLYSYREMEGLSGIPASTCWRIMRGYPVSAKTLIRMATFVKGRYPNLNLSGFGNAIAEQRRLPGI